MKIEFEITNEEALYISHNRLHDKPTNGYNIKRYLIQGSSYIYSVGLYVIDKFVDSIPVGTEFTIEDISLDTKIIGITPEDISELAGYLTLLDCIEVLSNSYRKIEVNT